MSTTMTLHAGGQLVTSDELNAIPTPDATRVWRPVPHARVLAVAKDALAGNGWVVKKETLAVANRGLRFFGTLDLESAVAHGVGLAVGVRNSNDQKFPLGFAAGSRVFVCDNLAFSAELLIKRRHTTRGEVDFNAKIALAAAKLTQFREDEAARVRRMCETTLTEDQALAFIVRSMERKVIAHTAVPKVLAEWRQPTHDYGTGDAPTLWKLFNCYTTVLGPRNVSNPAVYAATTIRLNGMAAQLAAPAAAADDAAERMAYPEAAAAA